MKFKIIILLKKYKCIFCYRMQHEKYCNGINMYYRINFVYCLKIDTFEFLFIIKL